MLHRNDRSRGRTGRRGTSRYRRRPALLRGVANASATAAATKQQGDRGCNYCAANWALAWMDHRLQYPSLCGLALVVRTRRYGRDRLVLLGAYEEPMAYAAAKKNFSDSKRPGAHCGTLNGSQESTAGAWMRVPPATDELLGRGEEIIDQRETAAACRSIWSTEPMNCSGTFLRYPNRQT